MPHEYLTSRVLCIILVEIERRSERPQRVLGISNQGVGGSGS